MTQKKKARSRYHGISLSCVVTFERFVSQPVFAPFD